MADRPGRALSCRIGDHRDGPSTAEAQIRVCKGRRVKRPVSAQGVLGPRKRLWPYDDQRSSHPGRFEARHGHVCRVGDRPAHAAPTPYSRSATRTRSRTSATEMRSIRSWRGS